MTPREFLDQARRDYPHLTIDVRIVTFDGLGGDHVQRYRLAVGDGATVSDLHWITKAAKEAGILPDTSIRTFAKETYHG